jgi:septum formation inhibitor-activating ATPase MinD
MVAMSSKKRKIGYHVLKLKMEGTEDQYRDPQVVFDILDYLCANLDEDQRTFHEKRSQKSFLLLAASTSQRGALEREVTMASGKLYHRPLLRTFEVTPLDRKSPKKL